MSVRSFQGAEIFRLASEMLGSHSSSITRDTGVKVTGVASWKLAATQSEFFETAKTKPATDVITACMMNYRTDGGAAGRVYRICTAGDNGGNPGRWYLAQEARQLKIYSNADVEQAAGTTVNLNAFNHITLMDDGTTAYLFLNGNLTPDMTWVHGQGAWNAKPWGPSSVQTVGKAISNTHHFDDVICFDDQDGRMDKITPGGWDGDTTWRVERATPNGDVETGFTPSTAGSHYVLVDEDVPDKTDYVWAPLANSLKRITREAGTDYGLPAAGSKWGFTHDTSPAGNEWTDSIFDAIATGLEDTTDSVKELMDILDMADMSPGSERIRAVRYLNQQEIADPENRFYLWRDTVLIGPSDPAVAEAARRRLAQVI